jgi:hypothetical protein
MATKLYYRTRTPNQFKRKYPNARVILDLGEKDLCRSASKWRKEHLIACRVIQRPGGNILPILKEFAPKPKDLKLEGEWANIQRLIDGLSKSDLSCKSHLELERENGNLGPLWSALAKCMASQNSVGLKERPQRERRQTQREGFVNYDQISPTPPLETATQSSPQSLEQRPPDSGEDDQDSHDDKSPTAPQYTENPSWTPSDYKT